MVEGAEPGRRIEITAAPMTIGRDAQQTLVFADTELSRRHARVSLVNDEAVVEDLGSTNGTFIDGKRITGTVEAGRDERSPNRQPVLQIRAPQPARRRTGRGAGPRSPQGKQLRALAAAGAADRRACACRVEVRSVNAARGRRLRVRLARSRHLRLLPDRRLGPRRGLGDALGHRAERAPPARAARRRFHGPGQRAVEPERPVSDGRHTTGCSSRCGTASTTFARSDADVRFWQVISPPISCRPTRARRSRLESPPS